MSVILYYKDLGRVVDSLWPKLALPVCGWIGMAQIAASVANVRIDYVAAIS